MGFGFFLVEIIYNFAHFLHIKCPVSLLKSNNIKLEMHTLFLTYLCLEYTAKFQIHAPLILFLRYSPTVANPNRLHSHSRIEFQLEGSCQYNSVEEKDFLRETEPDHR